MKRGEGLLPAKKTKLKTFARLLAGFFLTCALPSLPAMARDIVDMTGRHVNVPDKIDRIYATAPPVTLVVYAMKPESLTGWNFAQTTAGSGNDYLDPRTRNLPILGNMMGHGQQANMEEILHLKPDLVVAWINPFLDSKPLIKRFSEANVPLVLLKIDTLQDYPRAFELMGEILDEAPRAAQLSAYVSEAISKVQQALAAVPEDQRIKVYYAESPDGLSTDCDSSIHSEAIKRAGGINVYQCAQAELVGLERVSLEQIVQSAPDIIVSQNKKFTKTVSADPRWREVKAARSGNVVSVPDLPFNWIDRPPSYMQALGIQWLANRFYPQAFPLDLKGETKHFYELFLNVHLSDQDVDRILD